MKKVTIKLKYDELLTLDQWLGVELDNDDLNTDFSGKCMVATLKEWHLGKLKAKTYFRYAGKTAFRMNAPAALAFAWLISKTPIDTTHYMGGKLLAMMAQIDQVYA